MPATAEAPASLSDIIQAAQAATSPAAPESPPPDAVVDTSLDTQNTDVTTTDQDDQAAVAADDASSSDSDGGGTAADSTPTEQAAASIDWGAAMPALAAKAKELLGEEAGVLTKYGDIDGLIRSIAEREKQVGQQSAYVGAFNQLAAAGVTIQDLQALMAAKRGGPATAAPANNGNGHAAPSWSKNFLAGRDAEGKPIFNRAELARHGLTEAQAAQAFTAWQDQLADIFSGPEGIQQLIASVVDPRLGQATQNLTEAQQKALLQQQAMQQQQVAQKEYELEVASWANKNASTLYVNKKDVTGGVTRFFQDMERVMGDLGLPSSPSVKQLEAVKNAVLAMNRPAPAATQANTDKAKRQPANGVQRAKLSMDDFFKKFGDRIGKDESLSAYIAYESEGKVPAASGA